MTHRDGEYAKPSLKGRSHATEHHYVPERFFGRSKNRPGTKREAIFEECPWGLEGKTEVFCYECHEELIHNPVFLPEDIRNLAELVRLRQFSERTKSENRDMIAGRIRLLHEVSSRGVSQLLLEEKERKTP
jgi:hypothetical protein